MGVNVALLLLSPGWLVRLRAFAHSFLLMVLTDGTHAMLFCARPLSLSLSLYLRICLALSNNDRHTTAKPVCKTSSGAIRILRARVLAHSFPCAAATGFTTAYRAIVTRILSV